MAFGGGEGLAPPPGQSPDLDAWFAAITAELLKAVETGDIAASRITSGTFGAGNFIFPGDLTITSNLLPDVAGGASVGSATLPWGKTYIGNAAFTGSDGFLNVLRTDGSGSSDTLLAGYSYLDITAAATGFHLGFEARIAVSATTGTVNAAASMELFQVVTGAAAITSLRGLLIQSHLQTGSGVTTTYQAIRIQDPIVSAGSITTAYGIDIDDITAGGTNFAIRTGLGKVEFGGDLRLGVTDGFVTLSRGGANTFNYVADAGDSLVFMAGSSGLVDFGVNSVAHLRIQAGTGLATFTGGDLSLPGTLAVMGATTISSTIRGPDGSETAPTFSFSGDTDSGLFMRIFANQPAISAGGSEVCFFFSGGIAFAGSTMQLLSGFGTAGNPGVSFNNRGGDGMFSISDSNLGWSTGGVQRMRLNVGLQMGAPTGGDKGAGTINANAVYDDNVLLTDWVFDLYYDGRTRHAIPEGGRLYTLPETREVTALERRLPWMPTREVFEDERSLGGMVSRLWFGQEQQQVYIDILEGRIAALENTINSSN